MNLDGTSMTANMENDNDKKCIRTFITVSLENDDDDDDDNSESWLALAWLST